MIKSFDISRRTFIASTSAAIIVGGCDDTTSSTNNDGGIDVIEDIEDYVDTQQDIEDITDIEDTSDIVDDGDVVVIDERPPTTVSETLVGVLAETAQFEDGRPLFGKTKKGPGEDYISRDDLGGASVSNGTVATASSLAYFAQLTDIHIVDEESPARAIHSPFSAESAWRPQESYSMHMLDSALKTINNFADYRKHDFVLFSGDLTDNHLNIELSSFLGVVEGSTVDPDTGNDDDPRLPGLNDPHDPFEAIGLRNDIPWYACLGNHDYWALGSVMTSLIADPTSSSATLWLSDSVTPVCFDEPPCIGGYCYSAEPDRCHVPVDDDYFSESSLVSDPQRAYLGMNEFMAKIIASDMHEPPGHGFSQSNIDQGVGYWVSENVVDGLGVAMVALDSTSDCSNTTDKSIGEISQEQLNWLDDRLTFLESQNKIIIVTSHHPSGDIPNGGNELKSILMSHPNVVLHVVGHGHMNSVYSHPDSNDEPWNGYWEVQSPSTLDWPQQLRFFEIVDNGDATGSIYATVVDFMIEPGDISEAGRFYALLDVHEGRSADFRRGNPEDRNVILKFAWPPALLETLSLLPKRPVESENFRNK
ncbi:MAG: metallophosphoesterase [Deltaproteobacteria bacterium]|nr:metallophosphoesterase [Deltaproteobacteria bacterium]